MSAAHVMGDDDARELSLLVYEIYHNPSWRRPSKQHKRVLMLLTLFAGLERTDDGEVPTLTLNVPRLANRAGVKYQFASDFIAWLMRDGYLVPVTSNACAFCWHVQPTKEKGGDHAGA